MDGGVVSGPISAATIGSVVATTIKISQIVYELKAVGEQTRDLLDSTQHVSNNLQTAKNLRRQKSLHLDATEKTWIDSVLNSTDKTLNNVAALIEPARVDMQTKFGKIGMMNRGLFVFRDSPKVQTHLARLSIASGSLDTVLGTLMAREGRPTFLSPTSEKGNPWSNPSRMRRSSFTSLRSEDTSPPLYSEQEFVPRRRDPAIGKEPVTVQVREWVDERVVENSYPEPLCTANWSGSPIVPSTYATFEMHGDYFLPSSELVCLDKTPTIQVQEIPMSETPHVDSRVSSMSFSTQPPLRSRNSVSSVRSYASTVVSESSIRSSGRQRGVGRSWMMHQSNR